ncbi:MAG: hypothetical protein N4A35_13525 [Flavobacteriales bacterium]|jgi:hypothetical protein|nr:hypothetical protein [Flavobacteriales bacterium]
MLRKVAIIILILTCLGSVYFIFQTLEKRVHQNTPIITSVPESAAIIFELEKPITFWRNLSETNLLWSNLKNTDYLAHLDSTLNRLDSIFQAPPVIRDRNTIISLHQGSKTPEISVAFTADEEEFKTFLKKLGADQPNNQKHFIYSSSTLPQFLITYSTPFVLLSSNESLLQTSIQQINQKEHLLNDSLFASLYHKGKSDLQLYYNTQKLKSIAIPYLKKEHIESWNNNKQWASLDCILNNDKLLLNGLANFNLSGNEIFKNTNNIKENLLPKNIREKTEYAIEPTKIPNKIESTITAVCNCAFQQMIEEYLGQRIGVVTFGQQNSKAYYIQLKNDRSLTTEINHLFDIDSTVQTFHDQRIYQLKSSSIQPLLAISSPLHFTFYENYLVISDLEGIKQLAFEWKKNKHTKPQYAYHQFAKEYLAQQSNYSFFSQSNTLQHQISEWVKPQFQNSILDLTNKLQQGFYLAYQSNYLQQNLYHEATIVKTKFHQNSKNNELWNLTLGTSSSFTPQLLKNHRSKSLDILIQDNKNNIHLINAAGNIKWSKQLQEPILGTVQQIDIYGNNKYQMAFNTSSHIYVIDINGNFVKGFPIQLESKASSPLTIFDYERNFNYRFWISCENLITYNYDKEGKKVVGWSLPKSSAPIRQQYKRTVFNQKDYIYTLDEAGELYFINRRGESIFSLPNKLNARKGKITLQKRATLGSSAFIYQNDSTGKIQAYSMDNITQDIIIDTNNSSSNFEIIDIDNNKFIDYLSFNQNKVELYGLDQTLIQKNEFLENVEQGHTVVNNMSGQKFIVIQKENTDEIIILDKYLNQVLSTPIKGSLQIAIDDINSDGKQDIVTITNSETIKVYYIN